MTVIKIFKERHLSRSRSVWILKNPARKTRRSLNVLRFFQSAHETQCIAAFLLMLFWSFGRPSAIYIQNVIFLKVLHLQPCTNRASKIMNDSNLRPQPNISLYVQWEMWTEQNVAGRWIWSAWSDADCDRIFNLNGVGVHYGKMHDPFRFDNICGEEFPSRQGRSCHITRMHSE